MKDQGQSGRGQAGHHFEVVMSSTNILIGSSKVNVL